MPRGGIDFIAIFQVEIAFAILSLLDDPADIIRVCAVSRSWFNFVIHNGLSRNRFLRKAPHASNIRGVVEQEEDDEGELIESDVWDYENRPLSFEHLKKDHQMYLHLLKARADCQVAPKDCIECVVGASSTNRYPNESVVQILFPGERYSWGGSYWSSQGQRNPSAPESIVLKLVGGVSVVYKIFIQPFQAYMEPGNPIYSAMRVRFHMGHPKAARDLEVDSQTVPLQQLDENNYVWMYTSPEFTMAQVNKAQCFKLPEPVFCIGGYLKIELLGRAQKREADGLYYICINEVYLYGHTLRPAFDIQMGTDESIRLKYLPDDVEDVLDNILSPSQEVDHEDLSHEIFDDEISENRAV